MQARVLRRHCNKLVQYFSIVQQGFGRTDRKSDLFMPGIYSGNVDIGKRSVERECRSKDSLKFWRNWLSRERSHLDIWVKFMHPNDVRKSLTVSMMNVRKDLLKFIIPERDVAITSLNWICFLHTCNWLSYNYSVIENPIFIQTLFLRFYWHTETGICCCNELNITYFLTKYCYIV